MCPVEFGRGEIYTREPNGEHVPLVVLSARQKGTRSIVTLSGITDPNEAKKLTHKKIYIRQSVLPELKKGEYYSYQIMGLDVVTVDGREIGKVVKIFSTGSNDVYEVKPPNGETILIPAIKHVVLEIDLEKGRMVIEPMEGMLD